MAQSTQNPFDIIFGYLEEQNAKLTFIEYQLNKLNLEKEAYQIPPDDLTISDAEMLSVQKARPMKKSQIYKETMMSQKGKSDFPCKKFRKRVVIPRKEFLEWLEKNTVKTVSIEDEINNQIIKEGKKKLIKNPS